MSSNPSRPTLSRRQLLPARRSRPGRQRCRAPASRPRPRADDGELRRLGVRAAGRRGQRQALHGAEPGHQGRVHAARSPALQREDGRALQCRRRSRTAFYVRDTNLGAWVEAGWVQPIDGMPGLDELNKDIFPFNLRGHVLQGQAVRHAVLRRHLRLHVRPEGRSRRPASPRRRSPSSELKDGRARGQEGGHRRVPDPQGLQDQRRRARRVLVDGLRLRRQPLQRGAGSRLSRTRTRPALGVLEWMVEAMHDWKILDPTGLELDETQARDAFVSGQGVFTSNVGNVFPRANNPQLSKRAGDISRCASRASPTPARGRWAGRASTASSAKTKVKDAAWRLIYYMGGKDENGDYYTAKDWYSEVRRRLCLQVAGQGSRHDQGRTRRPATTSTCGASSTPPRGPARTSRRPGTTSGTASPSSRSRTRCLQKGSPRDALTASAKKARDLKKQWG